MAFDLNSEAPINGHAEKNNNFDKNPANSSDIASIYCEVMQREDRVGLPRVTATRSGEWMRIRIEHSNLGYSASVDTSRGRIGVDSNITIGELFDIVDEEAAHQLNAQKKGKELRRLANICVAKKMLAEKGPGGWWDEVLASQL